MVIYNGRIRKKITLSKQKFSSWWVIAIQLEDLLIKMGVSYRQESDKSPKLFATTIPSLVWRFCLTGLFLYLVRSIFGNYHWSRKNVHIPHPRWKFPRAVDFPFETVRGSSPVQIAFKMRSNDVQMAFATVHPKHVHVNIRSRPFLYVKYRSWVKFIRATLKYVHISKICANFHVLTLAGSIIWRFSHGKTILKQNLYTP